MKVNKTIFLFAIFLLIAFLFAGCGMLPQPTKGAISGRILIPPAELSKDVSGWLPAANATVTIVDANGVTHTTTTDENGYYTFENISVKANTVVTATVTIDGKTIVLKDVIPQAVGEGEDYNAGTMDPESTALALVVEQLVKEEGVDPADIDLEEIKESDSFTALVEKVTEVLEEQGNVTEEPEVTEVVEDTTEEVINPPAPPAPPSPPAPTPDPEALALQALKDGTNLNLEVSDNVVTATVNYPGEIDGVLVDWLADAKLEVGEALPEGTKVGIKYNGIEVATEVDVGGKTKAYLSELLPGDNRPPITAHAGKEDVWAVTITPGALIDTTLTVKAVISKDNFAHEVVIASGTTQLSLEVPIIGTVGTGWSDTAVNCSFTLIAKYGNASTDPEPEVGELPELAVYGGIPSKNKLATGEFNWISGQWYTFTAEYQGSKSASITLGGVTAQATSDEILEPVEGEISITVKTTKEGHQPAGSGVYVRNLRLNGRRIEPDNISAIKPEGDGQEMKHIQLSGLNLSGGFVLEGEIMLEWLGVPHVRFYREAFGMNIDVR